VQYLGIDWAYRRAAWCAMREGGAIVDEGLVPADEDGLAKLVLSAGPDVHACVEMMSGAVWVRDRLQSAGWRVEVADARKVKGLAPLACKTDKVDARVLAELCRRDLVPAVWLPSLDDRALRERLKRRMHLVRMRTMARNRTEIGDIARFSSAGKLVGYAGLAPKIKQSGQSSRTGPLSKAGSKALRWAAVEAAQQSWRETNPWHQLYRDVAKRQGKTNAGKAAVARKVLIAAWHVLSREQPFKPCRPRGGADPVPASSHFHLAA
jgi:transposase